jgi:polysaccharide chain length determinant protein (PEP-CTERM system associated)
VNEEQPIDRGEKTGGTGRSMMNLEEMKFDDYLKILRRRRRLLVISLVLGPVIGYAMSQVLPKQYLSKSLVLIEQQQISKDYVQSIVPSKLDQQVLQIMETVLSQKNLQAMIERFGLAKGHDNEISKEEQAAKLRNNIKVKPMAVSLNSADGGSIDPSAPSAQTQPEDLAGFYVNVTYSDPSVAQQMCAEITSGFIEENLRRHEQNSVSTTDFLQKQVEEAKRKLDEQDQVLAAFKSKHIGQLPDEEQTNLNIIQTLSTQLDYITQALDGAQQNKAYTESLLAQQVENWKTQQKTQKSLNSPETIEAELAKERVLLADRESRYTSSHPDVIAARNNLEELQKRYEAGKASESNPTQNKDSAKNSTEMEPPQIVQLRSQLNEVEQTVREKTQEQQQLQEEIKRYQQRIQGSPVIEQQYKDLTRDHESALKLYNDLLAKRSESAMTGDMERRQEGERFRVLEPASLSASPSFPNPLLFIGGGFGSSLIFGICIVLLLETRDRTLHTERDVEVFLQLPVLARLPTVAGAGTEKGL